MAEVGLGPDSGHIAIAVSGGGDSMALGLLSGLWAEKNTVRLTALTVDHQLRPGSAAEADVVGGWLKSLNIDHRILTWRGDKPATGIQAAARDARYRLMNDWMAENDAAALLVAHQLEDQAETFLMRLEKGSGIDGLACMSAVSRRTIGGRELHLVRPLLGVARERLRRTLRDRGQVWLEDPSNRNPVYARTRLRALSSQLQGVDLPADRLARLAGQFGRLREILGSAVQVFLDHACVYHAEGYVVINAGLFRDAPPAIAERVLNRLVEAVGGGSRPPRSNRVAGAAAKIQKSDDFHGCTLGGCRIMFADNEIMICREIRDLWPHPVGGDVESLIWDRRFHIKFDNAALDAGATPVYLGPLGLAGWRQIVSEHPDLKGISIPHPVRLVLPALFDDAGVFQVPGLGYLRGDRGDCPVNVISTEFVALRKTKNAAFNASV